ncbi:MAG: ATP-binding protein, partial [Pseudomonadales bacterium]
VQMLRRNDLYQDLQEETLEDIVMPALIGGGITLTLLVVLIGFSLWPVMRLARQLEARSPQSLAPLDVRTPAREIRLLGDSLNKLISDVDAVLTRERQFANDVSHELRNPLTTFAVELASDEPDIAALKAESRRLTRLVEQLLTLARLEQRHWQRRFEGVALDELCARVIGQFDEKFRDRGMSISSNLVPATVTGDPTLIDTLCRNLLLNVLHHCPQGTEVLVEVDRFDNGARLQISDTGPGIEGALRAQMAEGFTRLDSKGEGYGLGLAICRRISDVHNASIEFSGRADGSSGLVVAIVFPT